MPPPPAPASAVAMVHGSTIAQVIVEEIGFQTSNLDCLLYILVLELFIKLRLGQFTAAWGRHRPAPTEP